MSRHDPKVTLQQVADHARRAQELCRQTTLPGMLTDWQKRAAFECIMEVLGEAVKRLPPELTARYPAVDWRGIAGMRDRVSHGYDAIDYSFTLEPYGKHQIEPKDTKDFLLSPARPSHISHHQCVKKLPAPADLAAPPFDSPADLFRAIANGNAKHSWVEVDFNEFKERKFKRGEVKGLFSGVLQRAIIKRAQERKGEPQHVTAPSKSSAPLKITARMEMRHTDKKEILLAVDVVNMGQKIAFIKKVAVVLPRLTVTAVKNPAIQFAPDTSELVAHQTPRLIEIKPDGGLFTWEMILRDNLQYGIEEIEGVKHGRGYVELTSGEKIDFRYRAEKKAALKISLPDENAEIEPVPTTGGGRKSDPEMDRLSNILKMFNEHFGTLFTDADRVANRIKDDVAPKVAADRAYQNAKENTPNTACIEHDKALARVMLSLLKDDTEIYKQFVQNESFKRFVTDMVFSLTSEK
jgi:uncharacterized protein with HEPN domain